MRYVLQDTYMKRENVTGRANVEDTPALEAYYRELEERELGALWNVWSHNFSNMFITPLSMPEYVLAQILSAAAKAIVLFAVVALVAAALFDFNVLRMGFANLALLFVNLLWFGFRANFALRGFRRHGCLQICILGRRRT